MNLVRRSMQTILYAWFLMLVLSSPASAQQDTGSTPPPKEDQPEPAARSSVWMPYGAAAADNANGQPVPDGPPNPYTGVIRNAGTGLPIFGTSKTPLRWGSFSIDFFEYIGIHDEFESATAPNTLSTEVTIFRTGLMFDHYILKHKSRIVLHYLPQMAISNGEIHANAATNNNLSVGTKFDITPRLNLTLTDGFVQTHSNPLIPQNFLAVDANAGQLVQNNFVNTNGNFLGNTASAVLEYALTPRTNFTVSPLYRYSRAIGNAPAFVVNGQTYAARVSLSHAFSLHRTMGITDSYEYLRQSALGAPQIARYNTTGAFYSEQLARTFWITLNTGVVSTSSSDLPMGNGFGFSGGFSLIKNFYDRVGLALAYTRGVTFNNYVTNQRSDRVDGTLSFALSRRISLSNNFGYYRELGVGQTNGKYASADLAYHFFGNFSLFTSYAYTFTHSATPQLLAGDRRTLAYGLRWKPPAMFPK